MERTLASFIRALRAAGAEISTAEAIDAARTMAIVGYDDRLRMKESLSVVLAKSLEEKATHDRIFDLFFSRPEPRRKAASDAQSQAQDKAQDSSQGDDPATDSESADPSRPSGKPQGAGGGGSTDSTDPASQTDPDAQADALLNLLNSGDPDLIERSVARAASAVGVDNIRFESQTAYFVRRTLEKLGIEGLEARLLARMRENTPQAQAEVQSLIDARAQMQSHVRAHVDRRFELFGRSATDAFMNDVTVNRSLDRLGLQDIERMKVVVARMARRLAIRHARRRRVRDRGHLDIRRTLRANAGNDGVPFDLVFRHKRKDRPKIVAICDVSGSVAAYVRFLLLFLYSLHDKVTDLRAFAFSNELRDVGTFLEGRDFDSAMGRILDEVGGGSTDYGQALVDLQEDHWETIDRRTTVLILGDGRSNHSDPRLDIFREMSERAKRVVWLCPEVPGRWGTGDSCILQYKAFCTHLAHCASALDLEQAIDEALQAYD